MTIYLNYYIKIINKENKKKFLEKISGLLNIDFFDLVEFINNNINFVIKKFEIENIYAKNKNLKENLFFLFVGILNKIPMLLIGKPGNSKTLAVKILIDNFRGKNSNKNFFKKFPKILPIYYQGSENTTSENINKVFNKANKFNNSNNIKNNNNNEIIPFIVFDEIGLCEKSLENPLKILHSLLDYKENNISFIGISNYHLDLAKMSRFLFLIRDEMDKEDLLNVGLTLNNNYIKFNNFINNNNEYIFNNNGNFINDDDDNDDVIIISELNNYNNSNDKKNIIEILTSCYIEIKNNLKFTKFKNFYGSRDYYNLIKIFLITNDVKISLLRNFSGTYIEKIILEYFNTQLNSLKNSDINTYNNYIIKDFNFSNIETIFNNLNNNNNYYYTSRFLLIFSEYNYSLFTFNYLLHKFYNQKNNSNYIKYYFGSIFPIDNNINNYLINNNNNDYNFKILNDIIISLEKGHFIVIKNLSNIYSSLFDLFNQNYIVIQGKKNCRISLGINNNSYCVVNDNVKLVIITDENEDKEKMPTPFLNRFEKNVLKFELNDKENNLVNNIKKWLCYEIGLNEDLCKICFVGLDNLNNGFIENIVLYFNNYDKNNNNIEINIRKNIILLANINFYINLKFIYDDNNNKYNKTDIKNILELYKNFQKHNNLNDFFEQIKNINNRAIIYTYSNILDNINLIYNYTFVNINEFKKEKDFIDYINNFLKDLNKKILLIKIDNNINNTNFNYNNNKIDYIIEYLVIKINEISNYYNNKKYILLLIYLNPFNYVINNIKISFFINWHKICIDNLNGKNEIFDIVNNNNNNNNIFNNFFTIKIFNEIFSQCLLSLNFKINNENKYNIYNHIFDVIKFNNDKNNNETIFNFFKKNIINNINKSNNWENYLKEISKNKIIHNINDEINNYFNINIKDIINDIIFIFEENFSFFIFFNNYDNNNNLYEQIFNEIFNKFLSNKKFKKNNNKNNNNIEIKFLEKLKFPFLFININNIYLAIKESFDNIIFFDNILYNDNPNSNLIEIKENNQKEIIKINEILNFSSYLNKYNLNENQKELYLNDIFYYYFFIILDFNVYNKEFIEFIINLSQHILKENFNFIYIFLFLLSNKNSFKNLFVLNEIFKNILNIELYNKIFEIITKRIKNKNEIDNDYKNELFRIKINNYINQCIFDNILTTFLKNINVLFSNENKIKYSKKLYEILINNNNKYKNFENIKIQLEILFYIYTNDKIKFTLFYDNTKKNNENLNNYISLIINDLKNNINFNNFELYEKIFELNNTFEIIYY